MKFSSQIKPISYLKSHTTEIVREIPESREPLLITQNGEAKLVVMDVESYEEQEETLALLKILHSGIARSSKANSVMRRMCLLNLTNNEHQSRHPGIS